MSENTYNNEQEKDPTKLDIGADDLVNLPKSIFKFVKDIISIKDEIEVENTIVSIKQNMVFRGSTIWILICSIFVASIGLNFNSVAVIIGAMLISPLMGPIRGVGLALATNDFKTLISALKNFGVMILFSVATATIYFWFTPIKEDTSELLGRVKPQAFDVLIAFFGGFAGIVASASNNKSAAMTIVPGVAIATALMPPLCTMSYGFATGEFNYSLGAFYLFLLNSVFICLSTVVLLRLLKFPKVNFVNAKTEKKVKIYTFVVLLLIVIPSIYKTVQIVKETIFETQANDFTSNVILVDNPYLYDVDVNYNNGEPVITVYSNGAEISQDLKDQWSAQLPHYIENATLKFKEKTMDNSHIESIAELKAKLALTQEQNFKLNEEKGILIHKVSKFESTNLDVSELGIRVKSQFPAVKEIFYGKGMNYNVNGKLDTAYTFTIEWMDSTNINYINGYAPKLQKMLITELEIADSTSKGKTVKVIW
ncbi:MAG: DUF389 domain-containing protein [Flavobacteriales bacterium]|nr:DUF389 domain-containing protein [Flavobacteriales bacterium]MCB9198328.1 DUF389 domain-containing protein [Flavobacteriales bacterium]